MNGRISSVLVIMFLLAGCVNNSSKAIIDYVPESDPKSMKGENVVLESVGVTIDEKPEKGTAILEVLEETDGTEAIVKVDWSGEWTRNQPHNKGVLEIGDATDKEFEFTLEVYSGANVGNIEGVAQIEGSSAFYVMTDSTCEIEFAKIHGMIQVEVTDECQSFGGNGTVFHGDYEEESAAEMVDLMNQGILTEEENELFKEVASRDYELFATNMMLFHEVEDLDGLETRVVSGFVRGVATSMRAIIMVNGKFVYAAAPSAQGPSMFFYTNDPEYKGELPKTIELWIAEAGMGVEVVFK